MSKHYSIREMSDHFDVTARTIRHYEELGLLSPTRNGTRRIFDTRDHVRLGLILRGKRIGFSLTEISEIINMYDLPEGEEKQTSFVLDKVSARREMLLNQQNDIKQMLIELDNLDLKFKAEVST